MAGELRLEWIAVPTRESTTPDAAGQDDGEGARVVDLRDDPGAASGEGSRDPIGAAINSLTAIKACSTLLDSRWDQLSDERKLELTRMIHRRAVDLEAFLRAAALDVDARLRI